MATQEAFRFRDHDNGSVALSSTSWGVNQDANASFNPARRFRLRVQIGESGSLTTAYKLQWRKNAGTFADVVINSPGQSDLRAAGQIDPVEIVANSGYVEQDATTDLLTGGTGTFVAGDGMDTTITSGSIALNNQHTELEWSLWYHLYDDDGAAFFADGDTIEFRVVQSGGTTLTYSVTPTVTVDVPVGYIGFNPGESPGHIGPFVDANDNLYALIEISAHNPLLAMVKSTDGGDTWAPVDMAGVPSAEDLEGIDAVQDGDVVHVAHWATGTLVDGVYYHRFNLSDHGTPDQWAETDTVVDNAGGAGLARRDQACTIQVLSNGDLRVLYIYETAPVEVGMRSRISGTWDTSTTVIFDNANGNWTGVGSVIDPATNIIYVVTHDDATEHLRGKAILANGTLQNLFGDAETTTGTLIDTNTGSSLEEEMNFTPPVLWDDGGTKFVFVAWIEDTTLDLESATIQVGSGGSVTLNGGANSTTFVSRNVGQGRMPDVSVARDSTGRLHMIYAIAENDVGGASELYRNWSDDDGATWESSETLADTRSWESRISMPRALVINRGGSEYLGWLYFDATLYEEDADPALLGNDAAEFTGHMWYEQVVLNAPAAPFTGLIIGSPVPT